MKRSESTDERMRDAISWDPGCSDDEIEWKYPIDEIPGLHNVPHMWVLNGKWHIIIFPISTSIYGFLQNFPVISFVVL